MKKLFYPFAVLAFLAFAMSVTAQTEEQLLAQLFEDERTSVEALVLYPEKTRMAILESSKYPEALIKLESMQSRTSGSFRSLMEPYPKQVQEIIWDLARYPGLIPNLVSNRNTDPNLVLKDYPEEIHPRARDAFYDYPSLLMEVDRLDQESNAAFEILLRDYPPATQDAMQQLIALPEVLDILTDNIRMTVLVGDLYKRRPVWLLDQLDSLNLVVARERAKELDNWKASLDENPQAKQEFLRSTEEFARDYGYDDTYYTYDDDLYYYDDPQQEVVVRHHYYHYPYWFGYPSWYVYPRWRPYPWWWDWGFYWGPNRMIVIVGLPSYYYTSWYFYQPYHHYNYPHLSSHFVNHYYGHRTSSSSVTSTVRRWRNDNKGVVTEEFLTDARTKPAVIKEFGKFEEAREKYNRSNVAKPQTQQEFLEKNRRKYPELQKAKQQVQVERTAPQPPVEPRKTEPTVRPPVRQEPAPTRPKVEPKAPERPRSETQPAQKQPRVDIPKVDQARDHHKNTWEKSRVEQQRPQTAPPRVSPPRTTTPRTQPPPAQKPPTTPRTKGRGN